MTALTLLRGGKKSPSPPPSPRIPYAVLRYCPVRRDQLFLCDKQVCPFDRQPVEAKKRGEAN